MLFKVLTCSDGLGFQAISTCNQDLSFQFNFKRKLGRPVSDKKVIHLLDLKESRLEQISALYHVGISSGSIKLAPPPPIRRDI